MAKKQAADRPGMRQAMSFRYQPVILRADNKVVIN